MRPGRGLDRRPDPRVRGVLLALRQIGLATIVRQRFFWISRPGSDGSEAGRARSKQRHYGGVVTRLRRRRLPHGGINASSAVALGNLGAVQQARNQTIPKNCYRTIDARLSLCKGVIAPHRASSVASQVSDHPTGRQPSCSSFCPTCRSRIHSRSRPPRLAARSLFNRRHPSPIRISGKTSRIMPSSEHANTTLVYAAPWHDVGDREHDRHFDQDAGDSRQRRTRLTAEQLRSRQRPAISKDDSPAARATETCR
jgi:hypothetical protein